MAERLAKLGIERVQDLLFHLPLRYQDRTQIYPIGSLIEGQAVLIEGDVEHSEIVFRKRRMLLCQLSDGTGRITLRFFHFSNAQYMSMTKGKTMRCFGEIRRGPQSLEIVHPEYKLISATNTIDVEDTLTPTYPTTEGLQQRSFRRLIDLALTDVEQLAELIPASIQQKYQLTDIQLALKTLHNPPPETNVNELLSGRHSAQKRLIFEEMMAHHISLRKLRERAKELPGLAICTKDLLYKKLLEQLPFTLTKAQQRVIQELRKDLQQGYPMNRLVQGDVGSGKTLVAAAAALYAIESGFQVALMAPTEILAEQHFHNFKQWLEPLDLEVSWISGKQTARERRSEVENLLMGITHIAIGTHALFQADVQFNQLGLVIIDEQHRFGVDQRLALREKGKQADHYPHQLIMTATPIPRTLAMTACADLDYSVIDELPPGRQAIKTVALPNDRRAEIIQRIHHVCLEKKQVYWVCTLIEESEVLQCQNAEETCELLKGSLPDLEIGLVHGRMKSYQKDIVMSEF
jgi:ATP-dependent DNA helicase RecG